MDFDHSFVENFPHVSAKYPENPFAKLEIPTMVPVKPMSNILLHPSLTTSPQYQNDFHHFQHHHLNGYDNQSGVTMEGTSSINPICLIPTPLGNSYKAAPTTGSIGVFSNACNPMTFLPNTNKIEAMHGYLNNGKNMRDFSENLSPLSPSLVYDSRALVPMNLWLHDELSDIVGTKNNLGDTDRRPLVGDNKIVMGKSDEIHDGDTNIIKGQWTAEEDRALVELVEKFGLKNWSQIAKLLNCRIGKQCRDRWHNHLRPNIKKDSWTEEEDKILIESHKIVGNQWVKIARRLPWRTENSIKNRWNVTKRKLNVKKRNGHKGGAKGKVLLDYIREVITVEGSKKEVKQSMSLMNIRSENDHNNNELGLMNVHYESSDSGCSSGAWATQEDKVGGYVPAVFEADNMANGSDTMNYEVAMKMMLEDPIFSKCYI